MSTTEEDRNRIHLAFKNVRVMNVETGFNLSGLDVVEMEDVHCQSKVAVTGEGIGSFQATNVTHDQSGWPPQPTNVINNQTHWVPQPTMLALAIRRTVHGYV